MKSHIPGVLLFSATFATLSLTAASIAAERNLQFASLPPAVQDTARGVVGSQHIVRVIEEREGTSFYTVEYSGLGGRSFEVEISPEGKILENGELVNSQDTPEPVHKKIQEMAKGVVWLKIIKSERGGRTSYIVKFDRGGDNEDQFVLDAKGAVVRE